VLEAELNFFLLGGDPPVPSFVNGIDLPFTTSNKNLAPNGCAASDG
jgi:hypothetical protein